MNLLSYESYTEWLSGSVNDRLKTNSKSPEHEGARLADLMGTLDHNATLATAVLATHSSVECVHLQKSCDCKSR